MSSDDVKASAESLSTLLKMAGESEEAKQAAANIGQTAITVTKAINNVLLPLAAVNFAFDKSKEYYNNIFPDEISAVLQDIPSNNLKSPEPSLIGPALQGLAFSHEDNDLRRMYLNLIAASMDTSRVQNAHPAFVDVLRQITPFEAQLVGQLLEGGVIPVARVVLVDKAAKTEGNPKHLTPIKQHLLKIIDSDTQEISSDKRLELMVDNFDRLGLISVDYNSHFNDTERYDWAAGHPYYRDLWKANGGEVENSDGTLKLIMALQYGSFEVTVFGRKFAEVLGLSDTGIIDET